MRIGKAAYPFQIFVSPRLLVFYVLTFAQHNSFNIFIKFHCLWSNLFTFHHLHHTVCKPLLNELFAITSEERS